MISIFFVSDAILKYFFFKMRWGKNQLSYIRTALQYVLKNKNIKIQKNENFKTITGIAAIALFGFTLHQRK
jgi:regulatory protein YycI of two-component signal transduction system YycFG